MLTHTDFYKRAYLHGESSAFDSNGGQSLAAVAELGLRSDNPTPSQSLESHDQDAKILVHGAAILGTAAGKGASWIESPEQKALGLWTYYYPPSRVYYRLLERFVPRALFPRNPRESQSSGHRRQYNRQCHHGMGG